MRSTHGKDRSQIATLALWCCLALTGYAVADLAIIYFRDRMIPNQPPPKKTASFKPPSYLERSQFNVITTRNIFASNGIIPDAITANRTTIKKEADPVPSSLPLNLIGTLVHSNPAKSIAAVEVKSKNMTGSYLTGAEIEGLAKVESVTRGKVFIRNNNTGALEYIEMKSANKVTFDAAKASAPPVKPGGVIQKTGDNQFQIKKADLLKYTNDLSSVLMQARAVPNRDPNTGEINGFRILDMEKDSIFTELGLQPMDVIRGVNGEPVDSIQKAMEMYNTFKNGTQVQLQIDRGGRSETKTYNISN